MDKIYLAVGLALLSGLVSSNLSIVNIIKFENGPCNGTNSGLQGTCYTARECGKKGGIASGSCASGFGVCCTFEGKCGGHTNENITYFKSDSPSVAKNMKVPCEFKVCPMSKNICQLRLDFINFEIGQPETTAEITGTFAATGSLGGLVAKDYHLSHPNKHGQCIKDSFSVTSPGRVPPVICGENSGMHMYVDADGMTCNSLSFQWLTYNSQRWNIKVSQIECGAAWAAPKGCLQYYTDNTAEIKSFNFNKNIHLADQYYDICVRANSKKCKICYAEKAAGDFQVSKIGTKLNVGSQHMMCNAVNLVPNDLTKAVIASTNMQLGNDWVSIVSGATTAGVIKADRFCGGILHHDISKTASETVCSMVKPFRMGVHFDGSEAAGTAAELTGVLGATTRGDKGFRLIYDQKDC
jgi:hypothetical protein